MKLFVIKIGGNIIDDEKQLASFLNDFSRIKYPKILIHGGGKIATKISEQLGIKPQMIDGRRITNADTLQVVQMVYGGLINKNIVAKLQSKHCNAIGLSGADGNIILAKKRTIAKIDYGYVGDVTKIQTNHIHSLFKAGFTPVIAPLTHDGNGQILNTNADTMASAIASSLAKKFDVNLIYCFEKSGVLRNMNDEKSLIPKMNIADYKIYIKEKIISKGMIPKLDNAFEALKKNVKSVVICHANELKQVTANKKFGTRLEK